MGLLRHLVSQLLVFSTRLACSMLLLHKRIRNLSKAASDETGRDISQRVERFHLDVCFLRSPFHGIDDDERRSTDDSESNESPLGRFDGQERDWVCVSERGEVKRSEEN